MCDHKYANGDSDDKTIEIAILDKFMLLPGNLFRVEGFTIFKKC